MNNQIPPYGPPPPPPPPHGYGPPYYQQPAPPPATVYVQTQVVKAAFNHTPHIIITFLTCGGWFPFWMLIWACH